MRRYLSRRHGKLAIDRGKVKADRHLDGKFLLSSSDDGVTAEEIALYNKPLIEDENCWRDQIHILDLRPIYHRKEDRIHAHVLLSFLALLLCRVAETRTKDTWRNLRRELERIQLGYFQGSAGRCPSAPSSPAASARSSPPSRCPNRRCSWRSNPATPPSYTPVERHGRVCPANTPSLPLSGIVFLSTVEVGSRPTN
jgi:hypothetical protein